MGSEVPFQSSGLDSELPPQELQPDPWLVNQDPTSCARVAKKEKRERRMITK